MIFTFKPMTPLHAEIISTWKYQEPYNFYDFETDAEIIDELLNGDYFCAFNDVEILIGYFCFGNSARVPGGYAAGIYEKEDMLDIGLGLEPSKTGKGLGRVFVKEGIDYLKQQLDIRKFRLVVASFNQRAIKVYVENGFVQKGKFLSKVNGTDIEFICMIKAN